MVIASQAVWLVIDVGARVPGLGFTPVLCIVPATVFSEQGGPVSRQPRTHWSRRPP